MKFAELIREARKKVGLSQGGLAQQMRTAKRPEGVWPTYVGQIEKGEKVPSEEMCVRLAKVLELDTTEILLAAYEARADSEEARDLDENANGFIERDEFVGTPEEFALMDRDENNLVSPGERAEGFTENNTQIQMVLQAYRFSRGTFQNRGGVIHMTV